MSVLNPSRYVSPEMHSGRRPASDADLPRVDPGLFAVEDAQRPPDHMHGLAAKKKKTPARAGTTSRSAGDGGGAALVLGGLGLIGLGLMVGSKYRR